MALPILDGNQSATTLSTIVTGGQHIPAHTVVSLGSQAITDMRSAVSGSVVSISNFPASQTVAGTVTANLGNPSDIIGGGYPNLFAFLDDTAPNVTINGATSVDGTLPISGTVTANMFGYSDNETSYQPIPVVPWDEGVSGGRAVVVKVEQTGVGAIPVSGTVTVGASSVTFNSFVAKNSSGQWANLTTEIGSGYVNARVYPSDITPFTATVTVGAMPSGAITTRFGSVTTANTIQLTSCVTNTSRKFLLVQNIATSTVTIGIGFAPTTTQGIQLTAGAGLTFDAFCPTGGVWWLSSTTGSNFSILEG